MKTLTGHTRVSRVFAALGCISAVFTVLGSQAAVLVHDFYLPLPEAQIKQSFSELENGVGNTIESVFSVVVTGDGTQIFYDEWEDGYEVDLANPIQSSSQVWGDGDNSNGIAPIPGLVNDPVGLTAGEVLFLRNEIDLPRNPGDLKFDGKDRMAATKALVVSRAGWATNPGPVLSGAVEVSATIDHGTTYVSPVGEDLSNNYFDYVGFSIMATEDNTSVTIDPDGTGSAQINTLLGQGESYLVNGGVETGGWVDSTKPVQVQLIIGRFGGRYMTDWFTLVPFEDWSSSYFSPVGSAADGNPCINYFYNPNPTNLTIHYVTRNGSGSFAVAGNDVGAFQMPQDSGARFVGEGGAPFFALAKAGARSGGESAYDWGFTLLPADGLTSQAIVGWGPGSSDGSVNGSPVWVTATADTTVLVDYNGDHVGPLTDGFGDSYDTEYTLEALESVLIYDPDGDQTAMRLYTEDGTLITAAWGEDPDRARPGNPYFDFGTTVLPFPTPVIQKTGVLIQDNGAPGLSMNDVIRYTIQLDNRGLLPLGNTVVIDSLPPEISYVTNSTFYDGNPIADDFSGLTFFPLDEGGFTIPIILRDGTSSFSFDALVDVVGTITNTAEAAGYSLAASSIISSPPGGGITQADIEFTDGGPTPISYLSVGDLVYVQLSDPDGNQFSGVIETKEVTVLNPASGDSETITLTETGPATGIFVNLAGLPTSGTNGLLEQDGTLRVTPGQTISVEYTDPNFGDSDSASVIVQVPSLTKILYLTEGAELDRIDPVYTGDVVTETSPVLSAAGAGLTTGNTTVQNESASNSSSFGHDSGSNPNRLLLVSVVYQDDTDGAPSGEVSSISYGGQALSRIGRNVSGYEVGTELWMLNDAPSGSNTVSVSMTGLNGGTDLTSISATTFSGVDTSEPISQTNSNSGVALTGSLSINSAADELVYGAFGFDNNRSITSGPSDLWNTGMGDWINGLRTAGTVQSGSASVNLSWSWEGLDGGFTPGWGIIAVSIRGIPGSIGGSESFTQAPVFATDFTLPVGGVISVTNYVASGSSLAAGSVPVSATLSFNGTNLLNQANASFDGTRLIWSEALSSEITIPAGEALEFMVENGSASAFALEYDSVSSPAKIGLPTTTVIDFLSYGVYDAPYPAGNPVSATAAGATLYLRAAVSDPFGAYDITDVDLAVTAPDVAGDFALTLTDSDVVASNSSSKVYEMEWNTGADTGIYTLTATANEGTEGITDQEAISVSLIFLDIGTPGNVVFTDSDDGAVTTTFALNDTLYVRVTDVDQNLDDGLAEQISVLFTSGSDAELLTLLETGADTGIFTGGLDSSGLIGDAPTNNAVLYAPEGVVIQATYIDPDDEDDAAVVTGTIESAPGTSGITVNKSLVSPANGQAARGDFVRYAIQVVNTGSDPLNNIGLTDEYPGSHLTYVASTVTPDFTNATQLVWNDIGSLNPGESYVMEVDFQATALAPAVTNVAFANSGGTVGTNSAPLSITESLLDVSMTLINPPGGSAVIGGTAEFEIQIVNRGNTAIPTLPVENLFSAAQFAFSSASVAPDGVGAGAVLWSDITGAGSLLSGETNSISITLNVVGAGSPAENTARIEYAEDEFGRPVPVAQGTAGLTASAAHLGGSVFNDLDISGDLSVGDTGLPGITVQLFSDPNADGNPDDGSLVRSATTGADGYYDLPNLGIGDYVIVETDLPGYASSAPADNRIPVSIVSLVASTNNNFFDYLPVATNYTSIGGTVWLDTDGNGTLEPGESNGIENAVITLIQDLDVDGVAGGGEPVVASVSTDAQGNYTFYSVVSGAYVVVQTDLFGHTSTYDADLPNDNQIGLSLTNGQVSTGNDFYDYFTGNTPGNDAPTAVADNYSVDEDNGLFILPVGVLTNDIDLDGDTLSAIQVTGTTNGLMSLNSDGGFVYTPSSNFFGADQFSYAATDGMLTSTPVFVSITVNSVNDVPTGLADSAALPEDGSVNLDILSNDSDIENSPLSVILVTSTSNGTLIVESDNSVTYTPDLNFWGADSFTYAPFDGTSTGLPVVVNFTVTSQNDLPIIGNDSASTDEDTQAIIPVLVNDTDPDGNPLVLTGVSGTNATISSTNVVYNPPLNYNGTNVLEYYVSDGFTTVTGTLTLVVNSVNDDPIAGPDSYNAVEDTVLNVAAPGVLGNDNDVDGDALTALVSANPTNGVLALNADGSFIYTPATNYVGPDSFQYVPFDGTVTGAAVIVSITVADGNDAPTTVNDSAATDEDVAVAISVLANDTDPDGDSLTLTGASTLDGTVMIDGSGTNLVYTPSTNWFGTNTVYYYVTDGSESSTGEVAVVVASVNDLPSLGSDSANTDEDTTVLVPVLINDTDDDGDMLTITGISDTNATFSTTNVVYTPPLNFHGTNTLYYYVDDGFGLSTGTLTIVVAAVNDDPVAGNDSASTYENTLVNIPVLENDSDVDGDSLTLVSASGSNGVISVSGTNVVYDPANGFIGSTDIEYVVSDGMASITGLVSVSVTASADLSMMLSGPTNGIAGLPMTFVLSVANSGPSAASNIVVQKELPSNQVFRAVNHTGVMTNNLIDWPVLAGLGSGDVTNFTIVVEPENPGIYSHAASASSGTFDPDSANNSATSALSRIAVEIIAAEYDLFVDTVFTNHQTGLFEQMVTVTNTMSVPAPAFRLEVDGLRSGVTLWNATGTTNGVPYVQMDTPLNPGEHISLVLEFYVPDYLPFTNVLSVVWTLPEIQIAGVERGSNISRWFWDSRAANNRFIIEFEAVQGEVYTVLYSDDLSLWYEARPPIVSGGNRVQWYDDGPPKTRSHPSDSTNRFYKVIQH